MNILLRLRKSGGLTQYELARLTGVSQTRICQIELQHEKPSLRNARILAVYLSVGIEEMFPDGIQASPPLGRFPKGNPGWPRREREKPCPPTPRPRPKILALQCWKCRADRVNHNPTCYQCGAEFEREARA